MIWTQKDCLIFFSKHPKAKKQKRLLLEQYLKFKGDFLLNATNLKKLIAVGLLTTSFGLFYADNAEAKSSKKEIQQATQIYQQAYQLYLNNDIKGAADAFMLAAKKDENNPLYELFAGDTLRVLKQYPASIRYYEAAIDHYKKADKEYRDRILIKAYMGLSIGYREKNDDAKAIDYALRLVKAYPDEFRGYYTLGNVYAKNKKTEQDAIAQYKLAIEKDKEQLQPYLALAALYNKQGNTKGIIETYKEAVDYRPLDEALKMSLAQVYLSNKDSSGKGQYKEANEVLKSLVSVNNANAFAHYYLGLTYILLGDKAKAEDELAILNNLNPNLGNRLYREANAYYRKHENDPKDIDTIRVDVLEDTKDAVNDTITISDKPKETKDTDSLENKTIKKQIERMQERENVKEKAL
jgi:tetratricopeptide (TPR) repeat protein